MNKLLINTPQNVNFEYKLASVASRILAFAIDYAMMILYMIFIMIAISKLGLDQFDDWTSWGIVSLATLPMFLYPLILETFFEGQTLGKKF